MGYRKATTKTVRLNLRKLLKREGLTLTKLGERTGISYPSLIDHAQGRATRIDLRTLAKLKVALRATWDDLMRLE